MATKTSSTTDFEWAQFFWPCKIMSCNSYSSTTNSMSNLFSKHFSSESVFCPSLNFLLHIHLFTRSFLKLNNSTVHYYHNFHYPATKFPLVESCLTRKCKSMICMCPEMGYISFLKFKCHLGNWLHVCVCGHGHGHGPTDIWKNQVLLTSLLSLITTSW